MATLDLIIKGSDETKAAVQEVAGGLHDVGDAADAAGQQGGGFFSNLLSTAGGFLAANVIGAISSQFTAFVSDGVTAARDTNKLVAETEQLIKTTGSAAKVSVKDVTDLATALSASMGKSLFGDDQIQKAENVALKYRELKVPIADVTKLSLDMAQRLGTEPAAAAETLARALQKPEDASGRLAKMGIVLSDSQEAVIKKMIESGDAAGAQAYLMEQLNGSFGGAAEAAAKADGGMAQFKDRLGEAGETIGAALIPVIDRLIGLATQYLIPILEQAATWIGANLPAAIDTVTAAFGTIGGVIDTVVSMFSGAGESSAELGGVLGDLGGIWQQVEAIIKVAVELIQATVVPAFDAIAGFLLDHKTEIIAILQGAWDIISGVVKVALAIIQGVIATVTALIKGDWEGAWEAIKTMFSGVWDGIKQILSGALAIVENELSMAWDAIKGTVEDAWNGIMSTIQGVIDDLVDTITGLPGQVADVGRKVVQAIWDGIEAKWGELVNWFNDKLKELTDKLPFSEPKDPSSPLYGLSKSGIAIIANLLEGLESAIPDLLAAGDDLTSTLRAQMDDATGELRTSLQDQINAIEDAVDDLGGRVSDALAGAFDATAAIDRTKERNLAAISDLAEKGYGQIDATKKQLADAEAEAAKITDPKQAADYYALRSKQIIDLAKLLAEANAAGIAGEDKYNERIALTRAAQEAELAALKERQSQGSASGDLATQLQALLRTVGASAPEATAQIMALLAALGSGSAGSGGQVFIPPPAPIGTGQQEPDNQRPQTPLTVNVTYDERGAAAFLSQFVKVEVQQQTAVSSRGADVRQRTR